MTDIKFNPPAGDLKATFCSLQVRRTDGNCIYDLSIDDVLSVISSEDVPIKIIFKVIDEDPCGNPVHSIEIGKTTIDDLLNGLGWGPENTDSAIIPFLMHERKVGASS